MREPDEAAGSGNGFGDACGDAAEVFRRQVRRLSFRCRLDRTIRYSVTGLFSGLLAGAAFAAAAPTLRIAVPVLLYASLAAAAGALSGALIGLVRHVDALRLLIRADGALGSRELASTAYEITTANPVRGGIFSAAVVEDAARLLRGSRPRQMLGRLRLPLLPYIPVLAVVIALACLFPIDLRSLLARRPAPQGDLRLLGEYLEGFGERMETSARERNLGRSLELARELAELGRDLAESNVQREDALDRLMDLERRLAEHYDLRLRGFAGAGGVEGQGSALDGQGDQEGQPGSRNDQAGGTYGQDEEGAPGGEAEQATAEELESLENALRMLREKRQETFSDESPEESGKNQEVLAQSDPSIGGEPETGEPSSGEKGKGQGIGSYEGEGDGAVAPGAEYGARGDAGKTPSSAPGTTAVPDQKGPPSILGRDSPAQPLKAETKPGEGDSMEMLVRALPNWKGSKLPDEKIIGQYARQAESALVREEVPVGLREYVKSYFTLIGMDAGAQ